MAGSFATLADLCRAEEADPAVCTAPPRDCGPAGRSTLHPRPPFTEARVIEWRNACDVALRTGAGWWLRRAGWATSFLHNGERYLSEIDDVGSVADGALVVRGSFIHWTCGDKMAWLPHPRFDEWYECEERVVVCAVGSSGAPRCTAPVPVGYTTYCRDATPPHANLAAPLAGVDFHSAVRVTRHEIVSSGGSRPVDGPLPGWSVVAADAGRRRHERHALPPPRLRLRFP